MGKYIAYLYEREDEIAVQLGHIIREHAAQRYRLQVIAPESRLPFWQKLSPASSSDFTSSSFERAPVERATIQTKAIESLGGASDFEVANALQFLQNMQRDALSSGCPGLFVLCDMAWLLSDRSGIKKLAQLSAALTALCADEEVSIYCLFDRRLFSPTKILEILPFFRELLFDGQLCRNIYHVPSTGVLSRARHAPIIDDVLQRLKHDKLLGGTLADEVNSPQVLKLLSAIIDSMGDGLVVVNDTGKMILCNKSGQSILGFGLSELPLEERVRMIGNYLPDTVTPYPVEQLPITRAFRGESTDHEEIFIRNENRLEGVWVSATGRPLQDENGELCGGVVVFRDITAQKDEERERERLEARMSQKQKLESLGLLAGGIAHDFNNLLMGVLGNAGLALLELPHNSGVQQRIEQIKTAATRLAELTNQLLAYSGQGTFVEEMVDASALVQEMQELLKTVVSKRADMRCDFGKNLPIIRADATQVRQIVMNLITNASDALCNRPGTITISTGQMVASRDYLASTCLADELGEGDYVYIEVRDSGCGMDEQTIARIFDPFFSTKYKGRGLGLAAVLGLVYRHRGTLKVESKINGGTAFRVLFPVSKEVEEARPVPGEISRNYLGTGTVLIVDDEDIVRTVAKEMLERWGFKVLTAENGREGLDKFQKFGKGIVAVLLDMTMPDMSGEEVFRRLKHLSSDARVILSSGYAEKDTVKRFAEEGLAGYLQKPYVPEVLISKIREALEN